MYSYIYKYKVLYYQKTCIKFLRGLSACNNYLNGNKGQDPRDFFFIGAAPAMFFSPTPWDITGATHFPTF